eukprot:1140210-Pelagomonas_calceolata.AAC.2
MPVFRPVRSGEREQYVQFSHSISGKLAQAWLILRSACFKKSRSIIDLSIQAVLQLARGQSRGMRESAGCRFVKFRRCEKHRQRIRNLQKTIRKRIRHATEGHS